MATLCLPSSSSSVKLAEISSSIHSFPANPNLLRSSPRRRRPLFDHFLAVNYVAESFKWRAKVSFFPFFSTKTQDTESLKLELLEAIAPLDRGAEATPEDQKLVDQAAIRFAQFMNNMIWFRITLGRIPDMLCMIASKLEAANKVKEPLKSSLLNGKWELLYTTSQSILQTKVSDKALVRLLLWQRPKFLRANGKIYQAINTDTLRAQNIETWPFFNQATADLIPLNARGVAVKFDSFKIAGLIPIKNRGSGRGQLEITYLDEELRRWASQSRKKSYANRRLSDLKFRIGDRVFLHVPSIKGVIRFGERVKLSLRDVKRLHSRDIHVFKINLLLIFEATGTLKSRDCSALCTNIYPTVSTKSKESASRVLKVSSALAETAASVAVAATVVGAAATILVRRNKASKAIEALPRICEDCGGSGVCAECRGEGFVLKKMSDENAERLRLMAKNAATRYTAGLPKKWSYCMKCNAARSCSSCGGVGNLHVIVVEIYVHFQNRLSYHVLISVAAAAAARTQTLQDSSGHPHHHYCSRHVVQPHADEECGGTDPEEEWWVEWVPSE
ncbi:hypothetical protein BC332_33183 [Capsicum chinense]|nr:hypothetical protein BC332_33183 [Capsicum chinense]